jgi:hypothetical protein
MGRTARGFIVVALFTAAVVLAVPLPAQASAPPPGSVTATVTDVCGFVKADFANAGPKVPDTAYIRFSRNGKTLDSSGQQIKGRGSATLYQVAAAGDLIHYEWDVAGGGTESVDHVHGTPSGCAEPKLGVSLIDSCGPDFTISVANSGTGSADVLITAPTLHSAPYTVPAGGNVKITVPGVSISGAWVGRLRPDAGGNTAKTAIVDAVQRAPGCGIPWPNDQVVTFTSTCNEVSFILYALDMRRTVLVSRNGVVVLRQPVDRDIYKFSVAVQRGDVVTVGDDPPLLTYTHQPPAGCTPAVAPGIVQPGASGAAGGAASGAGPSAWNPAASGSSAAGESAVPPGQDGAGAPAEAAGPRDVDATLVALITVGSVAGLAFGLGGWFLIGALRRRRRPVWAIAFQNDPPEPEIGDIGVIPTTSVRWIIHPGSTAHYLREDMT